MFWRRRRDEKASEAARKERDRHEREHLKARLRALELEAQVLARKGGAA